MNKQLEVKSETGKEKGYSINKNELDRRSKKKHLTQCNKKALSSSVCH
jgi:hypothetical protein